MWNPLKRDPTPSPTPLPGLAEVLETVAQLRSEVETLRFEWAEVLDRIHRWSAREAARRRRDVMGALSPENAEHDPEATPAPSSGLTAKQELRKRVFGAKGA